MKSTKEILKWLKANEQHTGGLTSTDTYALVASVNLSNLISYPGAPKELFEAYRSIVSQMQPTTRYLAYHAIACELDWSHRTMIWVNARMVDQIPSNRCKYE